MRFGGRALSIRFVNEEAWSPEIERWESEGSWRSVPITARNVRGMGKNGCCWCRIRVVRVGWLELRSRKRSRGSVAAW